MQVTIDGDRFATTVSNADPRCTENELKAAGWRWDGAPDKRYWYTTSVAVASALKQYADKAALDRIAVARHAIQTSHSAESPFDFPCPDGFVYKPYQKAGIAYAYSRWSTLFGDDMGLGKTIQAIGVVNATGDFAFPVIVVCPAHLRQNWYKEFAQWLFQRDRIIYVAWDSTMPMDYTGNVAVPDVLICNFEKLRGEWLEYATAIQWGTAIVDEVQYIKNDSSQRTRAIYGYKGKPGVYSVSRRKLALSGTVIENKVMDIWPLAHALAPDVFPSKAEFTNRYCGGRIDAGGAARAAELQEKIRSSFMIRRLKKDVEKELPKKQRQLICVQPEDAETMQLLATMAAELKIQGIDLAVDGDIERLINLMDSGMPIAFSKIARIRALLGEKKAPYVASHVCNVLDENPSHQTIVYAHHKNVCEYLAAVLSPYGCALINGDTPQRQRQAIADDFCRGAYRAIICSLEAAATGFNLQAAWHVVFAEIAWKPSTNQQAEARVDRIGQVNAMLIQYFAFNNSLDSRIMELNLHKQKTADAVLD